MLEYKIKTSKVTNGVIEIPYDELVISSNNMYMSGVTPSSSPIYDECDVYLSANRQFYVGHPYQEYQDSDTKITSINKLQCSKVLRQGYFIIPKKYDVIFVPDVTLESKKTFYPTDDYTKGPYYVFKYDFWYFFDKDNKLYYDYRIKTLQINVNLDTLEYTTDGTYSDSNEYFRGGTDAPFASEDFTYDAETNTATINHKYYIENGIVKVDDTEFDLSIQLQDTSKIVPTIELNRGKNVYSAQTSFNTTTLEPVYDKLEWEEVYKFTIHQPTNVNLELDRAVTATYKPYVYYKNEKIYVSEEPLIFEEGSNNTHVINGNEKDWFYLRTKENLSNYNLDVRRYIEIPSGNTVERIYENHNAVGTITIGALDLEIGYDLQENSTNPTMLLLYVNSDKQTLGNMMNKKILVEPHTFSSTKVYLNKDESNNKEYIVWGGKRYDVISEKLSTLINRKTYDITPKTKPNIDGTTNGTMDSKFRVLIDGQYYKVPSKTNAIQYATINVDGRDTWVCIFDAIWDSELNEPSSDAQNNKRTCIKLYQTSNVKNISVKKRNEQGEIVYGDDGSTPLIEQHMINEVSPLILVNEPFVEIDNVKYPVQTNVIIKEDVETGEIATIEDDPYVVITNRPQYVFEVTSVKDPNILLCHLETYFDTNAKVNQTDLSIYEDILQEISVNADEYYYKIKSNIFDSVNFNEIEDIPVAILSNEFISIFPTINIYKPYEVMGIPLTLSNNIANNLNQENLVLSYLAEEKKEANVNRIIDMEKELYYPAAYIDDKLVLANELIFDLHFRTRDLETWTINEDIYRKDVKNANNGTSKNNFMCSWNVFDYYLDYFDDNVNNEDNQKNQWHNISEKPILQYFPPSDLLHFLDFNDKDVYYQKSKISKSFLRLLFYDSINPYSQSLLASSTIFLDEKKLFGKYCDTNRLTYTRQYDVIAKEGISTTRSVTYETCMGAKNPKCNFKDVARIDSKIVVKDRYNTTNSSEGFYLSIFKEYVDIVSGLHERTIYLKVQFNHAGTGKVIDMCFPFDDYDETLGEITYPQGIKLHKFDINGINNFRDGYELGEELYRHMYLPINLRYDNELKKYVYYLPKGMYYNSKDNSKSVRFNLFEIKVNNNPEESKTRLMSLQDEVDLEYIDDNSEIEF